jgi:hypothetical protein
LHRKVRGHRTAGYSYVRRQAIAQDGARTVTAGKSTDPREAVPKAVIAGDALHQSISLDRKRVAHAVPPPST